MMVLLSLRPKQLTQTHHFNEMVNAKTHKIYNLGVLSWFCCLSVHFDLKLQ